MEQISSLSSGCFFTKALLPFKILEGFRPDVFSVIRKKISAENSAEIFTGNTIGKKVLLTFYSADGQALYKVLLYKRVHD